MSGESNPEAGETAKQAHAAVLSAKNFCEGGYDFERNESSMVRLRNPQGILCIGS